MSEKEIMDQKLDENEMKAVSGGGAGGRGGCTEHVFRQQSKAEIDGNDNRRKQP